MCRKNCIIRSYNNLITNVEIRNMKYERSRFNFLITGLYLICSGTFFSCQQNSKNATHKSIQNQTDMNSEKLIIGTYTGQGPDQSKGIYLVSRDVESGQLTFDSLLTAVENPTFQALSPDGRFLFSVSETSDRGGSVFSYAILPDGSLDFINSQPSLGKSACHVAVNDDQTMLFVANYTSGVFTYYHLDAEGVISEPVEHYQYEGSGPHPNQNKSHPHQATLSPDQKYVYVPDLGTDQIHQYRIDPDSRTLEALDPASFRLPPGSGPRHMTFHPNQEYAYVINELGNTVQAMRYDEASGQLTGLEIYPTLPEDFDGESYCADIHISPDGHFLYGSNRGHNSLAIFAIDPESGRLNAEGFSSVHGEWPRNFYISEDGRFIYVGNQHTGNITIFSRDAENGSLSLIDSTFDDTFSPVCITPL